MEKNNPKVLNAWCMYDWANSVYSLTITTAVFPSYYLAVTKNTLPDGMVSNMVDFFGWQVKNSVLYSYALSFAFLLVALIGPFLSGVADYTGRRKRFMQFFSTMGALSCAGLFFFDGSTIELGVILFVIAGVGWAGSLVYYNAYLPDIATEDKFDKVSAKGYALGYIGSVLLLIINLAMILQPQFFGIPEGQDLLPAKISFLMVGIWWIGFASYTFIYLPKVKRKGQASKEVLFNGFKELIKVKNQALKLPYIVRFLSGFFLYSMGVQTVMYLATIFGESVIGLTMDKLIMIVVILQVLAILGAYGFSFLSSKIGNIKTIIISLCLWILVCVTAYFLGKGDEVPFYVLAAFVGLVMGGIQSISRSTYSKFIPQDTPDKTSYFSFYEFIEKMAIVLGTFVYGAVEQLTGSMNNSSLALTVFFFIGIIILWKIPSKNTYNAHV